MQLEHLSASSCAPLASHESDFSYFTLIWSFALFDVYNHGLNILRLFYLLPNFPFTTSEAKHDF